MSKDGGPAFPVTDGSVSLAEGMSLRDYFAAAAMPLAQRDEEASPTDKSYRAVAIRAYHYADAMLKAREQ